MFKYEMSLESMSDKDSEIITNQNESILHRRGILNESHQ